jgi:superfamily I DNA and/or RNA helicase
MGAGARWGGGGLGEEKEGESKLNRGEADKIMEVLQQVLAAGELQVSQVGIITPYVAQVRLLRKVWTERCRAAAHAGGGGKGKKGKGKKDGAGGKGVGGGGMACVSEPRDLEIASVDNFQGREKELIIFSAVRSNTAGNVGFLSDWRRLNVMLTRARRGMIVVGSADTLKHDALWQQWLEWFVTKRPLCEPLHT